jgi:uncharacterized protein YgiB involved in biofilm formation
MKRTEIIVLSAVGLVAVAALWPRGSEDATPTEAQVYGSVAECSSAGLLPTDECERRFNAAQEQQLAVAPKFDNATTCETEHGAGNCRQTTWNGASVFVPAMVGFLVARQFAGAQPLFGASPRAQACPPNADPRLRPDCAPAQQRSGGSSFGSGAGRLAARHFVAPGGQTIFRGAGQAATQVPTSAAVAAPVRNSVVSRGGFGSTGRSFSSSS